MADEIVIVGGDGVEHVFPAGFDPQKAATIVRAQGAGTETDDPDAAYWKSLKEYGKQVGRHVLDALPAAGAIGGGLLAAPLAAATLNPVTGLAVDAAGVGLGAGAGRGARDLLAEGLGFESTTSPASKAMRIGADTAISAATQAVVPGMTEAVKTPLQTSKGLVKLPSAVRKIIWNGEVAPELALPKGPSTGGIRVAMPPDGFEAHMPNTSGYGGSGSAGLNRGPLPTSVTADVDRYMPNSSGVPTRPPFYDAAADRVARDTEFLNQQMEARHAVIAAGGTPADQALNAKLGIAPPTTTLEDAVLDQGSHVNRGHVALDSLPASTSRGPRSSKNPRFTISDLVDAGLDPDIHYVAVPPATAKQMMDNRASRSGLHVATHYLDKAARENPITEELFNRQ